MGRSAKGLRQARRRTPGASARPAMVVPPSPCPTKQAMRRNAMRTNILRRSTRKATRSIHRALRSERGGDITAYQAGNDSGDLDGAGDRCRVAAEVRAHIAYRPGGESDRRVAARHLDDAFLP